MRAHLRVYKVIANLFVKIYTVCNHDKSRFFNYAITLKALTKNHFCKHNHGNGFSATLGMPYNSVTSVLPVLKQNTAHALFNSEILLISADLFDIIVVNNEVANNIK